MRCIATLIAFFAGALPLVAQDAPPLRNAASFAVLGGSSVNNEGPTRVTGNLGVFPGSTITGFPPGQVILGARRQDLAPLAHADALAAYDDLAKGDCTGKNPVDRILGPGVYCFDSSTQLTGTLTLDALGNPNAVWIFRVEGALTASAAAVRVINGGQDGNVFWRVRSAVLGENTAFVGNLIALNGIVVRSGTSVSGRLLALEGSVTLQSSNVSLCCLPIALSPESLPEGRVGVEYPPAKITASGGLQPYTYRISSGTLPEGLSPILPDGVISFTPTAAGEFAFRVTATDATGCTGTRDYVLVIRPCPLALSPPAGPLPPGRVGVRYCQTFTPSCGTPGYTCDFSGDLPPGLVPNKEECTLCGTPSERGTFRFTLTVTDDDKTKVSHIYTIDVEGAPCTDVVIMPSTIPNPVVGTEYNVTLTASGASEPYTFSSEELPGAGLSLVPVPLSQFQAHIFGPPTRSDFCFTVTATSPTGCSPAKVSACTRCPTITVNPNPPPGTVGVEYCQPIVTGGTPDYGYKTTGTLPPGLDPKPNPLGQLCGTPTQSGEFRFNVTAIDRYGCASEDTEVHVVIAPACPTIVVSPAALPPAPDVPYTLRSAFAGDDYSVIFTASGGTGPYAFTVSPGVPPDLGLDAMPPTQVNLSGPLTTPGIYTFTVTARDTASPDPNCTGHQVYRIEVLAPPPDVPMPDTPLSPWALAALAVLLAGVGVVAVRRVG